MKTATTMDRVHLYDVLNGEKDGRVFTEVEALLNRARIESLEFGWEEACDALDRGLDPRDHGQSVSIIDSLAILNPTAIITLPLTCKKCGNSLVQEGRYQFRIIDNEAHTYEGGDGIKKSIKQKGPSVRLINYSCISCEWEVQLRFH